MLYKNESCVLSIIFNNNYEEFEFKVDVSNLPYDWDVGRLTGILY